MCVRLLALFVSIPVLACAPVQASAPASPNPTPEATAASIEQSLEPPAPVARPPKSGPPFLGSAIQTLTGGYTYARKDIATVGDEPGLAFIRTYNNFDTRVTPLGKGWRHSYDAQINAPGDGSGNLILVGPQGRSDLYIRKPDGAFEPPSGSAITLVKDTDAIFTATDHDGTLWEFNASGRLVSITDPRGAQTQLTYAATGQLVFIGDPSGRGSLSLAYDPDTGRLASVADWMDPPRVVRYGYDRYLRLASVTDREGHVTRYTYDGESHRLLNITDARGNVAISLTYDLSRDIRGLVVARYDARGLRTGQATTFEYVDQPDGSRVTTHRYPTSSYDPLWPATILDISDAQGRLWKRVEQPSASDDPLVEQIYYDARGWIATRARIGGSTAAPPRAQPAHKPTKSGISIAPTGQFDPERAVRASLNAALKGATDVRRDAFGRVTSFLPDAAYLELNHLPLQPWKIHYDREDRIRSFEIPSPDTSGPPLMTESRYDEVGNLVECIDPSGLVTRFRYDERDSLEQASLPGGEVLYFAYDHRGDPAHVRLVWSDGVEEAADYEYDGLRRLRRVIDYPDWPNTVGAMVTEYVYDGNGPAKPFTYTR